MNIESTIHLCKTGLENDYQNTLTFSNENAQRSYFNSIIGKSFTEYTYLRKDKTIVVDGLVDDLREYNYLFYENPTTSKRYYCFITKHEYVSENDTRLYIETDVYQTWMFEINYRQSFIEREHVNDDTAGIHTVPENVEKGDYVVNNVNKNKTLANSGFLVATTIDLNDTDFKNINGLFYNGVYSGYKYYYFGSDTTLNRVLTDVANAGKSEGIQAIFACPASFVETGSELYPEVTSSMTVNKKSWIGDLGSGNTNIYKPSSLNGYTPKNKKLLTFPYCYLLASNNSGGDAIYKYELFNNPNDNNLVDFNIMSALTPGFSIRLLPLYYNNVDENNEEGLNLGKLPTCSWNTDVYTNWLTQNAVNIGIGIGTSALQVAGGLAMMGTGAGALSGASSVTSGAIGIASSLGEIYQHSLQPPQAEGNINSGDVTFGSGNLTFTMYQMSIKQEYAKIIDEYFSMYGYKVNRVKTPNITGRRNWNYVKTINCNFTGNIPQDDMQIIKTIFNNGVTLWHNPNTFLNYNANNDII